MFPLIFKSNMLKFNDSSAAFDKIRNHQPNNVTYWIPTFDKKMNVRWTKDPTRCQSAEILKVYQILMYKILRVGTYLIHFVVF